MTIRVRPKLKVVVRFMDWFANGVLEQSSIAGIFKPPNVFLTSHTHPNIVEDRLSIEQS